MNPVGFRAGVLHGTSIPWRCFDRFYRLLPADPCEEPMETTDADPEMIVVLRSGLEAPLRRKIRQRLESHGAIISQIEATSRYYFELRGEIAAIETLAVDSWPGVEKVVVVGDSSDHWAIDRSRPVQPIQVGSTLIGPGSFCIIAGPCAVEDEQRTLRIAASVAAAGADLFRGGAYKPRTSPYAFQGLGELAYPVLESAREETGLGIVTEVLDPREVESISGIADMLQVGSRNMHNYSLLKELGQTSVPVLLKRGFASTTDELLLAAEYILSAGNPNVILCERGIRCGAASREVVLDLGAVPELHQRTHLPVLVDPSHGSGESYRVGALARAAVAAGADGVLIEVHEQPEEALSDGRQALTPEQFAELVPVLRQIRALTQPDGELIPEEIVSVSGGEDR